MKKLLIFIISLLLASFIAVLLVSCSESQRPYTEVDGIQVVTIDNCEYIRVQAYGVDMYSFAHKGNCKYCAERRKEEYTNVVDSLFNMQE
ncbi:MAG: hypothetical protein IJ743_03235 [Bacilli bacterium]|nr:hypothetical protein [Bacilli bacterium]